LARVEGFAKAVGRALEEAAHVPPLQDRETRRRRERRGGGHALSHLANLPPSPWSAKRVTGLPELAQRRPERLPRLEHRREEVAVALDALPRGGHAQPAVAHLASQLLPAQRRRP